MLRRGAGVGCVGAGCTRSRASELFSTKKPAREKGSARVSYRAAPDVPIATARTVNGWPTTHHRTHDARPHQRTATTRVQTAPVLRPKDGTDARALTRDAGVPRATAHRYRPRGPGNHRPTIPRHHRRPGQAPAQR